MNESNADTPAYRFYGRRKGHSLSPAQRALIDDTLPDLRVNHHGGPIDRGLFGGKTRQVWLEIGFGGAEHLIWQARHNPDVGLIGVEPYINGIVKALTGIRDHRLGKVRLYGDDVRDLLPHLADGMLDRVFILFPDPWPKARHKRRRIVSAPVLTHLARAMAPGAELRLASDIPDYVDWMLQAVAENGAFTWTARSASCWRARPADWPQTRYEAKAIREGRVPAYLRFVRNHTS